MTTGGESRGNETVPAQESVGRTSGAQPAAQKRRRIITQTLVSAALALLFLLFMRPLVHHDVWHEMALVREALRLGHFPTHDPFSYTGTGAPLIYYEWGAGAIDLAAWTVAGPAGLGALNFMLAAALAGICVLLLRGAGFPISAASLLLAIWPMCNALYPVTAQAYSNLLFAVLVWFLLRDGDGRRSWIAGFLVLFVLWVNLHGGLVIAFVAVGATAFERMLRRENWRHLLLLLVAMAALLAANPNGTDFYSYLIRTLTLSRANIDEWRPFAIFTSPDAGTVLLAVTVAVFGYTWFSAGWKSMRGALMVLALALMSARTFKIFPLYLLAWMGTVPRAFASTRAGERFTAFYLRYEAIPAMLCVVALVPLSALAIVRPWAACISDSHMPVGPVAYLRQTHFRGNAMTAFPEGAYVTWSLYPDVKVGCDSRYDLVYSPEWLTASMDFYNKGDERAYQVLRARTDTGVLIVRRSAKRAVNLLTRDAWKQVYADEFFYVFARP